MYISQSRKWFRSSHLIPQPSVALSSFQMVLHHGCYVTHPKVLHSLIQNAYTYLRGTTMQTQHRSDILSVHPYYFILFTLKYNLSSQLQNDAISNKHILLYYMHQIYELKCLPEKKYYLLQLSTVTNNTLNAKF